MQGRYSYPQARRADGTASALTDVLSSCEEDGAATAGGGTHASAAALPDLSTGPGPSPTLAVPGMTLLSYGAVHNVRCSDHLPVAAMFSIRLRGDHARRRSSLSSRSASSFSAFSPSGASTTAGAAAFAASGSSSAAAASPHASAALQAQQHEGSTAAGFVAHGYGHGSSEGGKGGGESVGAAQAAAAATSAPSSTARQGEGAHALASQSGGGGGVPTAAAAVGCWGGGSGGASTMGAAWFSRSGKASARVAPA